MLVYGDAIRRESVGRKVANIRGFLDRAAVAEPWIVAHSLLVAALIESGELAQGIADRAFEAAGGRDSGSVEADTAMELTLALAEAVGRSWTGGTVGTLDLVRKIHELEREAGDGDLQIKLPEGFAHYALYPETYFEAAQPLVGRDLRVIGLRSIGTTLSAMVAAGAGAPCPMTVRPVGHPFGRTLALADPLPIPAGAEVAIADEGPGLSGSSIAAVAETLSALGVEQERIHLFPSHPNGPGPQASQRVRTFWQTARLHVRSFEETILQAPPPRSLLSWVVDLTGEPVGDLREITGGLWRDGRDWSSGLPPVHPWQERRKFLLQSQSGTWLLKFVGLGRIGLAKYERAAALAEAGFTPRPIGFRHGFTVERWHEEARPLDPDGPDRARFLAHLGEYLAFRTRHFPAEADQGASPEVLFEMLSANAREEFGEAVAAHVERWRPYASSFDPGLRRTETDSRLQAWEWFVLPDGQILKSDAVDHHNGHDLIGCQDIGWDVGGASVEFALSPEEHRDLVATVQRLGGSPVDRARVRHAMTCYSAFQLGYYREASAATTNADEAVRLGTAADRYSVCLRSLLASGTEPNATGGG